MHAATVAVGDQLWLYKALAAKPLRAEELAQATETDARYLREWLSAQPASGGFTIWSRKEASGNSAGRRRRRSILCLRRGDKT
jgi:hypothetical protein